MINNNNNDGDGDNYYYGDLCLLSRSIMDYDYYSMFWSVLMYGGISSGFPYILFLENKTNKQRQINNNL
jgi:hypothetical protein